MNISHISQLVAARRRAQQLTQAELAQRAGIARRTLSELESSAGTTDIGFRKLERILNILGLTVSFTETCQRPTEAELSAIFTDEDDDAP